MIPASKASDPVRATPVRSGSGVWGAALCLLLFGVAFSLGHSRAYAQTPASHPRLFFDRAGMDALQQRVLSDPRLNKIWQRFKVERVDSALNVTIERRGFNNVHIGRNYGDALASLTVAYVVTRDTLYLAKAQELLWALAKSSTWGDRLVKAHISMGVALAWDVLYDQLPDTTRVLIRSAVKIHGNNRSFPDVYSNPNWTAAAGEGLLALAFRGDGNDEFQSFLDGLLNQARLNFKERPVSVLWAHGTDGFPHEGLGYWRKYIHVGLFFTALRRYDPAADWFRLGPEYPGSEFLRNTGYPRIYADVQHRDLATLTWSDSKQVRGKYGNIGLLTLIASEYKDGYVLDFIDYLIDEAGFDFDGEDWATFLFYDVQGVPSRSYRDLPLSRYWPDMEAAIFRSGWSKEDLVFFMRCGSPGGHARRLKNLPEGIHDHLDANGFVLFYNNDYLAAEDGYRPTIGPERGKNTKFTSGHNTFLIDGVGQRGDGSRFAKTTAANMDYLDAEHVGYLLGDATDAYSDMQQVHRLVLYKKHEYVVILDELRDDVPHRYEFLLGTDNDHFIRAAEPGRFYVEPDRDRGARLLLDFALPKTPAYEIRPDRIYAIRNSYTDLLYLRPQQERKEAAFLSLHYPLKLNDAEPDFQRIEDGPRTGFLVNGDEVYLYNPASHRFNYGTVTSDGKLTYFKDDSSALEFLLAGGTEFRYGNAFRLSSQKRLVAAFKGRRGKIRLGKNLGEDGPSVIRFSYPGLREVWVDGQPAAVGDGSGGELAVELVPKQYRIGPPGYEQVVTDNYAIRLVGQPVLTLTAPNGGERWRAGTRNTVTWVAQDVSEPVRLEFSTNAGQTWHTLADSLSDVDAYEWLVPEEVSDSCLVRVRTVSGTASDESDAFFTILPALKPPAIESFQPTVGFAGTEVTIFGQNLSTVTEVTFSQSVADSFVVDSERQIRTWVPETAATGPLGVTNPDGVAVSSEEFVVRREAHPQALVLQPSDDAFVREAKPQTNYGRSPELRLRSAPQNHNLVFLKFSVSGLDQPVEQAVLRLHTLDPKRFGGALYSVSNLYRESTEAWREEDLIWDNAPELLGPALAFGRANDVDSTVTFDVSNVVQGEGVFSFAIRGYSASVVKYHSKENARPPELHLSLSVPAPSPPVVEAFFPSQGVVGSEVTIRGSGFVRVLEVRFGQQSAAEFVVDTPRQIRAVVPSGAATAPIEVATVAGRALSEASFRVLQPPQTRTFQAAADAFVRSRRPTNNYGHLPELRVRQPEADTVVSYLRFDLRDLSGEILQARLRLFVLLASADHGGAVHTASNYKLDSAESWLETDVTWQNAPRIAPEPAALVGPVLDSLVVEVDVTAGVRTGQEVSLAIVGTSAQVVKYSSREGPMPPELVVTFSPSSAVSLEEETPSAKQLQKPRALPQTVELFQNYPNPFNAETTITYALPAAGEIQLAVYNLRGQRVRTLLRGFQNAGYWAATWDGRDDRGFPVASGIYLVRLQTDSLHRVRKLLLQK